MVAAVNLTVKSIRMVSIEAGEVLEVVALSSLVCGEEKLLKVWRLVSLSDWLQQGALWVIAFPLRSP